MKHCLSAFAFCLSFGLIAGPARADAPPTAPSPFRYDDDLRPFMQPAARQDLYGSLKFIPLGESAYLSFGADLRERLEASDTTLLGIKGSESQTYDLHRLLVHADLHLDDDARVFGQLGDHTEIGRRPASVPTDVDRLDLSQLFIDLSHSFADGRGTLRIGRQEMSYDDGALIGLRDGPNVRLVWDGVRASYVSGGWQWDAFSVRPVSAKPGVFDDDRLPGQTLDGLHVTATFSPAAAMDAFWYRNRNPSVALFGAAGPEQTDTFGVRLRGKLNAFDGSIGGIRQTGDASGGREVRAFAAHADAGWSPPALPWSPHIALRADVLSGGAATTSRVSTFNGLYPNVAYSTEATIEAPANLIQTGLVVRIAPAAAFTVQYLVEGLWRYSTRDAFYAAPLFPLVRPDGRDDRYSGLEQQFSGSWRATPFITVNGALVHFSAGDFVRRGGGEDETFAMLSVALRL